MSLFAALIAPYFIDWSAYKRDFEREASRIVGQSVSVEKVERLRLLPMPGITFSGISVGETADGMSRMTADQFAINAELMPFLSGEIRIVDLTLNGADLRLDLDTNGQFDWPTRAELAVDPRHVNLQKMVINSGQITLNGLKTGKPLIVSNINADVSAGSLIGPWNIDARFLASDVPMSARISTGSFQPSGSIRTQLAISRDGFPYRLVAEGPLSMKERNPDWRGEFSIRPQQGSDPDTAGLVDPSAFAVRIEGNFKADTDSVEIREYRSEIGGLADPYVLSGVADITLDAAPEFALQVDGNQVDLARFGDATGTTDKPTNGASTATLAEYLAILRSTVDRLPIPQIPGTIDLRVPAFISDNTIIRDVRANFQPDGDSWRVGQLSALLPGSTTVEASGRLGTEDDFGFSGKLLVASQQPSGLAAWATGAIDPGIRSLSRAGFSSVVTLSSSQITLDQLELRLGEALLSGKLQRVAGTNGRDAIVVQLDGNDVDLSSLRTLASLAGRLDQVTSIENDLDVAIRANRLLGDIGGVDVTSSGVDARMLLQGGALSIERLKFADFRGAAITSEGRITNLLDRPRGNLKLNIAAQDLSGLAAFLVENGLEHNALLGWATAGELTRETDLQIEIDSREDNENARGQILVNGKSGGTDVAARLGFAGQFQELEQLRLDGNVTASNASPPVLMRQLGLALKPNVELKGPITASLQMVGTADDGLSTLIAADMPGTNISAQGLLTKMRGKEPVYDFKLTGGLEDATAFLDLFKLRGDWLANLETLPVSFSASMNLSGKVLKLSQLSGQVSGNAFVGELERVEGPANELVWSGQLALDTLSLPFLFSAISGGSGEAFAAPLLDAVNGNIEFTASDLTFASPIPAKDFSSKLVAKDGGVRLQDASAAWLGGRLTGDISFANIDGFVSVQSSVQLEDANASQLQTAMTLYPLLSGTVSVAGSVDASGRSRAALTENLNGSGIVVVENAELSGIDPDALSQMMLEADVDGFDTSNESLTDMVSDTALSEDARISLGDVSQAFTVAAGNVNLRNINASSPRVSVRGDAEIAVANAELSAEFDVTFDPGRQAVTGATPEFQLRINGPVSSPETSIDVTGLAGYFSLRAFEREQRRVEQLQATILEKQRLRRQILLVNAQEAFRARAEQRRREEAERAQQQVPPAGQDGERGGLLPAPPEQPPITGN